MKINYTKIDYSKFDLSGKGKNIIDKLDSAEQRIWEAALPFQDTRQGETGHAEFTTYFAFKLLEKIKGERGIVIPAIILHDIGWSKLTKNEHRLFYDTEIDSTTGLEIWQRYEPILRARHQEQGSILAEKILKQIGYPVEETEKILEINKEHDTRKEYLNINDGVVRDADKLWRFSLPCIDLWINVRKKSIDEIKQFMNNEMNRKNFLYSDISRKIAEIELENSLSCKKSNS